MYELGSGEGNQRGTNNKKTPRIESKQNTT